MDDSRGYGAVKVAQSVLESGTFGRTQGKTAGLSYPEPVPPLNGPI
ncbi:MAG TPA: hypothetical protein VNK46_00020 [Nitrospiraceae bacterium]|nr:hypothetical protein [Nitrospiraceae bacterium]